MSESFDRDLQRHERIALKLHHLVCRACRKLRQQYQFLREAFRKQQTNSGTDGGEVAPLSETAKSRMREAIQKEME